MLLALDLKTLEELVNAQIEHTVKLIKEEVDVFVGKDRKTGQVDGGEAQVTSAVGDLTGRIVAVADDAGTATHVRDLGLGMTGLVISEVVGRVDEGVVGEETLRRYAERELEQIVVRILGIVVDALFYLENVHGEDRGLTVTQTLFSREQDVLDDHSALGGGVGAVVDGGEGNLRARTGVHGVEVVDDRFHRLEGRAVGLGQRVLLRKALQLSADLVAVFLGQQLELLCVILSGGFELSDLTGSGFRGCADRFDVFCRVLVIREQLGAAGEVRAITLVISLGNAGRHAVIEVRYRLTAVLVVLVRLDRDAGECAVGGDIVGFTNEAVTGGEAVLEELQQVDLAAGGGEGQKVEVMDVDVALTVRLGELGVEDIHLIKFLCALGTVLEHSAHRGIAVDVGVLTLDVVILRGFEGQILIDLHQLGVHLADSGTLRTIKDELLRGSGVTVLDQDLLNGILYMLDRGIVVILRL